MNNINMGKQISWEETSQPKNNLLSPAYKSNGLVFTSGCFGVDPKSGIIPEDVGQQTILAIENLKEILEASGSSIKNVLKVLLFIKDPNDASKINEEYSKYFSLKPARSCVVVGFPNAKLKVEIECIAESQ